MLILAIKRTGRFDRAAVLHHSTTYLESIGYPHLMDLAMEGRIFQAHKENNQTHVFYPAPKSSHKIAYAINNEGRLPTWLLDKHLEKAQAAA